MGLNVLYALSATLLAFGFVIYLEAKGINHEICNWFIRVFNISMPLKDALAIYANSVTYKSNPDYNDERFKRMFESDEHKLVPQELFTLLQLARNKKLNLIWLQIFFQSKSSFTTNSFRVPI